jgi:hypothetical protein
MDGTGIGGLGGAGLWQEMRLRWQRGAPERMPAQPWGEGELPSLAEILARLPRPAAPAPEPVCCP